MGGLTSFERTAPQRTLVDDDVQEFAVVDRLDSLVRASRCGFSPDGFARTAVPG